MEQFLGGGVSVASLKNFDITPKIEEDITL